MFPYDAWFSLKNEPRFDLPGDEQQAFGEKVESKLRALHIRLASFAL